MKLFYAPQSPFARKVRASAIELGLDQRIQLEYAEVVPGRPNKTFAQSGNPLRRIPALVTDAGDTIFDSTVICEYLDALVGGSPPRLIFEINVSELLAVVGAQASCCSTDPLR